MTGYQARALPYSPDTLALFSGLQALAGSFLLNSSQGFAGHRFDVFSALPTQSIVLGRDTAPGDVQTALADMIGKLATYPLCTAAHPLPGWYGLLSYDLPPPANASREESGGLGLPVLCAGFYPVLFVADRVQRTLECLILRGFEALAEDLIRAVVAPSGESAGFTLESTFAANMDRTGYRQRFQRVQDYLHAGDCYQVNLAQRFDARYGGDPWYAYLALSRALPAPMGCFFRQTDFLCLSLSPERFLAVNQGMVSTHPIKGTRPRRLDPALDRLQAENLQNSEKDRAENLMIVDLLRNDLGLSCEPGSIRVTDLFAIESYANVHHLVSRIEGRLRPDIHPLQALLAAFPGGSITGAPKKRAREIIAELEPDARTFYCGSAFYCDVGGRLDSSILIRSLVCAEQKVYCWGGGGIVVDSTAEAEYQETLDKVGVILRTLEQMR